MFIEAKMDNGSSTTSEFRSASNSDDSEDELLRLQLNIWETAVKTQMHFNDMSAKARQHGISLVVVIVGFALFLLTRTNPDYFIIIFERPIHISVFITILPPIVLYAVMELDLGVYHKMLRGSVKFGENFEESVIRKKIMMTHQGMTQLITIYSRNEQVDEAQLLASDDPNFNGKRYIGKCEKTAGYKIRKIYYISIFCLILIPVILWFIHPEKEPHQPKRSQALYENKISTSSM